MSSMQAAFLLKAINVCSIGVLNGAKAQSSSQFFMIIKPDNVGFEQTMQENMYTIKVVHVLYSMDSSAQRRCCVFSAVSSSVLTTNGCFFLSTLYVAR